MAIKLLMQPKFIAQKIKLRLKRPTFHVFIEVRQVGILVVRFVKWRYVVGFVQKFDKRRLPGSHISSDSDCLFHSTCTIPESRLASTPPFPYSLACAKTFERQIAVTDDAPKVLISESEIQTRVNEIAAEISADYDDKDNLVMIGVLKGSFIFLADLSRQLSIPRTIEFIAVSSYGSGSVASGAVRLVMDVRGNIEGRHVLIVEDIVDTGHTLKYLIGMLKSHRPASVKTAALVRKADSAEVEVTIDYLGFDIGDEWVVGYGLDYAEQNRTLPYIGVIEPSDV